MKAYSVTSADSPLQRLNFAQRPRRIKLDQLVAIRGYGKLKIRPISPEDEFDLIRFHLHLSEDNIYLRYFEHMGLGSRTGYERLVRVCTNSPESYAIVLEKSAASDLASKILGVGRLTLGSQSGEASFDTLIVDSNQTVSMAKVLLTHLIKLARAFEFKLFTRQMLAADHEGLSLCRTLGFKLQTLPEEATILASLKL